MSNGQLLTTAVEERTQEPTTKKTVLELDGITKQYGSEEVIGDLSLSVRDGEILTLLGPSGCGKTTTLRLIAGLEKPNAGRISLQNRTVSGDERFVPPEDRDVGVVFQDFALFPHLTARENVAFGIQDRDEADRAARVDDLLDLVGLEAHGDHYPDELSGGQQQRIALARSLAPEPEMLLLDEPFSSLDVDLRVEMREEVRRIIKETGVTAISVTHDQEEALSISDRVAVMNDGTIEQIDTPQQVFQQPMSRFVAGFLGHASFLPGEVHGDSVDTSLGRVLRDDVHGLAHEYDGSTVDLLVRPDDVTAYPAEDEEADGRVVYRRYLGPTVLYRVELDDGETIECMHNHSDRIDLDERVGVRVTADHELAWFPADHREDGDGGADAAPAGAD
ncbi:ABC transporter ATP-binding protein [Natrinema halophilum]|uniref:Molybdate/tungstate import ATP-binding protein WtpC n=1 Tax=Natrinema halophilum TaxID=1699371 RepID=A0A7D5GF67_9EURY|nr:ABC transporter ATP-binding protein [Natrinema halophilum]QLG47374.1 ABC transporter ATP-binding protein [Natrinema halophilum]